jgi:ubiquitin-protein ligase E3 A
VHEELTLDEKKKLLEFCTGSDRVPIKGLSSMRLTISKQGPDSAQLPTSHTCFNHLLLPQVRIIRHSRSTADGPQVWQWVVSTL